jgi:DNA-binding response OmpR family regulator
MTTVLVVEDDLANAHLVTVILKQAGHQVLTANDGPAGIESAHAGHPDVILLDVSLAGPMDGLQLCRALRAEADTATTPVIMLSGWASKDDRSAGRAAGCDDYLAKPYSKADLLAVVQNMIDRPASH